MLWLLLISDRRLIEQRGAELSVGLPQFVFGVICYGCNHTVNRLLIHLAVSWTTARPGKLSMTLMISNDAPSGCPLDSE